MEFLIKSNNIGNLLYSERFLHLKIILELPMKSYLILPKQKNTILPEKFQSDDNRSSQNLVGYFIEEHTKKGDRILDPFAGLGTTLFVAEEKERIPFGIEIIKDRFDFIKKNLKHKENIILGDSMKLSNYKIPVCDFCFCSPPFTSNDDIENPFSGYQTEGNYQQYLQDYQTIFNQIKQILKPDAYIVLDIANLKNEKGMITTLAWDVAGSLSEILHFVGEIVIIWESRENDKVDGHSEPWRIEGTFGYGYSHSYCLVFQNK